MPTLRAPRSSFAPDVLTQMDLFRASVSVFVSDTSSKRTLAPSSMTKRDALGETSAPSTVSGWTRSA